MPTITSILGARPQFIKAAPLIKALSKTDQIHQDLLHTGQHYDRNLSTIFFEELKLPEPLVNLKVGSGSHGAQTGEMLVKIEQELIKKRPDLLVVYGDTNSTLAGALAGAKLDIPIAHVEAGLRSFNRAMPEEVNRVVADHLSNLLLVPTDIARKNLENEGFKIRNIHNVGDLMVETLLANKALSRKKSEILEKLKLKKKKYLVATIHRQENTDNAKLLRSIWDQFVDLAKESELVIPLHPRTKERLLALDLNISSRNMLHVIEPLGYLDMIQLVSNSKLLLTDSGGLQKEAFVLGVPCVTLRGETEWVELIQIGVNLLANPAKPQEIKDAIKEMQGKRIDNQNFKLYGDGNSSKKITKIFQNFLGLV